MPGVSAKVGLRNLPTNSADPALELNVKPSLHDRFDKKFYLPGKYLNPFNQTNGRFGGRFVNDQEDFSTNDVTKLDIHRRMKRPIVTKIMKQEAGDEFVKIGEHIEKFKQYLAEPRQRVRQMLTLKDKKGALGKSHDATSKTIDKLADDKDVVRNDSVPRLHIDQRKNAATLDRETPMSMSKTVGNGFGGANRFSTTQLYSSQ